VFKRSRSFRSSLGNNLATLAVAIGSLLPILIAWVLISSTNDENPLDAVPNYSSPMQETVTLSEHQFTAARTTYEYRNTVRLIIQGTLTLTSGASSDGFFTFADADGTPFAAPVAHDWSLTVNGAPITATLSPDTLSYDSEHVYTARYDIGSKWQTITFDITPDTPGSGDLRVTVIQIEE